MKPILIAYATREGQSRRIAEHLAATTRARGLTAQVMNVATMPDGFSLDSHGAAVLVASVHMHKHEREMVEFVQSKRQILERLPAFFLSVSLAEASVENPETPEARRAQTKADIERIIEEFLTETGWQPAHIRAVAGALMYTKYDFLTRFFMKQMARLAGGSTDTSSDHEYTNWEALDKVIDELLRDVA